MPTWEVILATLLFLQLPGKSAYSMRTVSQHDRPAVLDTVNGAKDVYRLLEDGEDEPTQCAQRGNVACYKPRKREVIYNLRRLRVEWQRPETYDEGLVRYAVIARAIHRVASGEEVDFPAAALWRFLVTIAYHESGLRRDVHIGRGAWAIGDCRWRFVDDPRGRERIPGTCRSHGLFQSLFSNPITTELFGVRAVEVIGDDAASTESAVIVAAKHLERLGRYCTGYDPSPFVGCIFAAYGGVTSTRDRRIMARVGTYHDTGKAPTKLDRYVRNVLGLGTADKLAVVGSKHEE